MVFGRGKREKILDFLPRAQRLRCARGSAGRSAPAARGAVGVGGPRGWHESVEALTQALSVLLRTLELHFHRRSGTLSYSLDFNRCPYRRGLAKP